MVVRKRPVEQFVCVLTRVPTWQEGGKLVMGVTRC